MRGLQRIRRSCVKPGNRALPAVYAVPDSAKVHAEGGEMQTTVRDLLKRKTAGLKFVREDNSVFEVVQQLLEHNISAVLVVDGTALLGIVTERDVVRNVVLEGRTAKDTAVREIMTRNVLFVRPDQTIEECMALMTDKRIRHLPVMDGARLIGILSIRDLVGAMVSQNQFVIEQLENY